MTPPLLTSKLSFPLPRPALVKRPRLISRLNAGLHGRLTLVSAPAGFGKTTLVTEWLRGLDRTVAWLSLDDGDNDPARFLAYLLAALGQIEAGFGQETRLLLQRPEPPAPELLLTTLLNEIAAIPQPFILALDDLHVIREPGVHQLLAFIVENQPEHMHLVIMTREDPALPLPRLRARGQLTELRQDDLRFSAQESAAFLQDVMGLDVSPEDVQALERRTEGWIAGLQLASIAMQSTIAAASPVGEPAQEAVREFVRLFAGSNRFVLDYLIEEVFERQAPDVQDFLLKTSILERLCGDLCDRVAGRDGSQELLEMLEGANLFIVPLDQSRTWYRYHRLFADLLRHRLRTLDDFSEITLHQRAYQWYQGAGMHAEAVPHALAAADWEQVGELIRVASDDLLKRGEFTTLLRWYQGIPEEELLAHPRLCFDYCWPLLLTGQTERAARYLAHSEASAQDDAEFLGEVLAAKAHLARGQGDHAGMVAFSQQALPLLPPDEFALRGILANNLGIAYWHMGQMEAAEGFVAQALEAARKSENLYLALSALIHQGCVMAVRSQLRAAAAKFQAAIQEGGRLTLNALAYLDMSALLYEWNDLEESAKTLGESIQISERANNHEFLVSDLMLLARLHLAADNPRAARQALDKAQQTVNAGDVPTPSVARLVTVEVNYALAVGDLAGALSWASRMAPNADCYPFHRFFNLTQARLLLAQGKRAAALQHLAECYQSASLSGWTYGVIAVCVMQALAAETPEAAFEPLAEALELASPEGFLRTFIDAGPGLAPRLQLAAERGVEPLYVTRILAAMGERTKVVAASQAALVEPLSERELEVLELVAAGCSNREIGQKLFISIGTAKSHVHHLCAKLGVRNRTEAAARARELGLI